nr:reverse transcriptase domain-containing protein [Tanacetum cinerariifolium]
MSFEISFTDALILIHKFASTLNEHCSAVILNKLPRKLGDHGKFLIPCEFPGMDECLALADLGASINLMPLSMWEALSLPKLTPTCMTLELADRSVSKPIGITKDVSFKTGRALIDVHKGELTIRIENEVITYNLDQTARYSANYNQMTENKIDVIEMAYEEYSQEVLGFSDVTASGNPTLYDDAIVSTTSPTLTPFGDSDFLLFEEADAFLGLEDDPNSPKINPFYYDPEGDILLLEAILNSKPLPPPSIMNNIYLRSRKNSRCVKPKLLNLPLMNLLRLNLRTYLTISNTHFWRATTSFPSLLPKSWEMRKIRSDKGGFTVIENEKNELIPTRLVTRWRGTNSIVSSMVSSGIFKFPLTLVIRRRQCSPVPREHLPIDACLSTMEVFMNDLSVFENSFENCISRLEKMLQRYEDTNLSLNWEKSHFMVKEGIILGHKISKNGIEVDRDKDYPDCEVFRALSFSFTRASHPQLHFGNPVSKSYRLTFSFGIPNKWP